ncbi:MAG: gliding motility protein GldC [Cyclobacteriaceae bacterium]|nr:MAG: gliding motility protein GldC [Cyclobacteriaceae bacterium]
MKKSEINFTVELDEENIPDKIFWQASDQQKDQPAETKSIAISLWDHQQKNTLRIDLWSKDMPIDEMKRFYVDTIGGMAQSILNATGDQFISQEMNTLCEKLVEYLKKEQENGQ